MAKELPGMPAKGSLTIAAEKYLHAKDQVEMKKHNLELCKDELLTEMKKAKRISLTIGNKIIMIKESSETITVRNVQ